jgi:hypothetical protein
MQLLISLSRTILNQKILIWKIEINLLKVVFCSPEIRQNSL